MDARLGAETVRNEAVAFGHAANASETRMQPGSRTSLQIKEI